MAIMQLFLKCKKRTSLSHVGKEFLSFYSCISFSFCSIASTTVFNTSIRHNIYCFLLPRSTADSVEVRKIISSTAFFIVVPSCAVSPVLVCDLPLLFRDLLSHENVVPAHLYQYASKFQQNSSRIGNLLFHIINLAISPFPLTLRRKAFQHVRPALFHTRYGQRLPYVLLLEIFPRISTDNDGLFSTSFGALSETTSQPRDPWPA